MQSLLHIINSTFEVPDEAYRICGLNGTYFYIKKHEYNAFCNLWIPHHEKIPIALQLYSAPHHALFFDLDFKGDCSPPNPDDLETILDTFESNLKMIFFPHVPNFTIIYAKKKKSFGFHVHLPEFTIAHDDYLELCKRLQISSALPDDCPLKLDAPINWNFPGIGKPTDSIDQFYVPVQMKYLSEDESFTFNIQKYTADPVQLDSISKKFKRIKKNNDSFFRKFITVKPIQGKKYLHQLMLPIVVGFKPRYKISYATTIVDIPNRENDIFEDIATITYYDDRMGYVLKDKCLSYDASHFLKMHQFLRHQSIAIKNMKTQNSALNCWYKMFTVSTHEERSFFEKINMELRIDNPAFLHDSNPLETVLKHEKGYFFLPVFFALVKHFNRPVSEIVFHLRPLLGPEYSHLLDRLEGLNEQYVQSIAKELTLNTIFFCAHNMMDSTQSKNFQEKLALIVKRSQHSIMSVNSTAQMSELLLKIQERYFPIKMIVQSNMTSFKATSYVWNALKHSWKEITSEKERYDHIMNLWTTVKNFLDDFRNAGGIGGPSAAVIDKLNLSSVVSTQFSNKSMELEKATMDAHKWFIRLENGYLLDLLTGHVGGVVPEFYMSSRTINISIPRPRLVQYLDESPTALLKKMYDLFVDLEFFTYFLKQLILDATDDIYDTASDAVSKALLSIEWENDKYAKSMLHFYIHLCKFVAFEYDLLLYLLDVLASTMVATNYKRKFFVCKGETNNGKSMLFEIVGRMFGQYYNSILSDNLQKSKSSSNAAPSPDLALTLFTCRIVAMEELESNFSENRIKQITGLSRVAFRSLFSVSQSAVPTAKVFVTTNNVPDCLVSQAFRERVVAFPFKSTFTENAPTTTSEKVKRRLYPKEEYVIEKSYEGCFFVLYFHFQNCANREDGLLHYRKEPECVVEFTNAYLENTDVYIQFKCHMDVQIVNGGMTTMTDLESAIRHFLKDRKAPVSYETEIKIKFEREFKEYRCIERNISTYKYMGAFSMNPSRTFEREQVLEDDLSSSSSDDDDDEENKTAQVTERGEKKKRKSVALPDDEMLKKKRNTLVENASAVYYENVMIKNLKKSSQFD